MVNKKLYENYHKHLRLQKKVIGVNDFTYRNILSSIDKYIPKYGTVLDIGSATGTISFYLANRGLNVTGLELSKNAVKYANLNKSKLHINNVNFINSSIERYRVTSKYSLITCFEVLEHIKYDKIILRKIRGAMNKESILAISVPSKNAPLYRLGLLRTFDHKVGHLRRYSMVDIEKILLDANFRIIKKIHSEGVLRNALFTNRYLGKLIKITKIKLFNNLISSADEFLRKLIGESQLILICVKN